MAIVTARAKLINEAVAGNVTAALDVARRSGCVSVTDLLEELGQSKSPSVAVVDTCCDAISLLRELESKRREAA